MAAPCRTGSRWRFWPAVLAATGSWLSPALGATAEAPRPAVPDVLPDAVLRGSQDAEVTVTLPALYTTYAVRETLGTVLADRPDWHSNPDVAVKWAHQFERVRVTASAGLLLDRYGTAGLADSNTWQGRAKLAWTDGGSDRFVPYVSYAATLDYARDFHLRDGALHDVAAGFTSSIGLDRDLDVIAYRSSTEPGQSSASLDARVGRRWADPADLQNLFAAITVDLSHNVTGDLTLSVAPSLRARWYESYHGRFRRDVRAGGLVRAAWAPRWLRRILPRSELSLGVGYQQNASTLRPMAYRQWEMGPNLEFGHKF